MFRLRFLFLILVILIIVSCGKSPRVMDPGSGTRTPGDTSGSGTGISSSDMPELMIQLEPSEIKLGDSAMLTWESRNASQVTIEPAIGDVDPSGRIKLFPEQTIEYSVTASGPGGSVTRNATVSISAGSISGRGISSEDLGEGMGESAFESAVRPVFFLFDSYTLSDDAKLSLDGSIRWLNMFENRHIKFVIEGHTDARGTEEYNLALGDKRASIVKDYMILNGIEESRIMTVSMGEERPFDTTGTDEGHSLNRRAHFVLIQ